MDIATLSKLEIEPVLFREETVFMREISMDDTIRVNVKLKRIREDGSRWTFYHEFHKDEEKVAATATVDSAWIDLKKRKLTALPDHFLQLMLDIPRAEDFEFDIKSHVKKPENRHIQSKPGCFTQLLLTKIH